MNKSLGVGVAIGAAVALGAGAFASYKVMNPEPQYAQVLHVKALTRTVRTPHQSCHDESVVQKRDPKDEHQIIGSVAGAVVGGVLGHQIGGGRGKDLATVAGAAAGGFAGNRIQKTMQDRDTYTTTEQRCETVYEHAQHPAGYEVRYRIGDREETVRMDHDPGDRIPLKDGQPVLNASTRS